MNKPHQSQWYQVRYNALISRLSRYLEHPRTVWRKEYRRKHQSRQLDHMRATLKLLEKEYGNGPEED